MTRQSKATWREKQRSLLTLCHLTFITAPHAWLCRSNLVDMAQDTSIQFGQDPPLFSKPPGWKPPAAAQRPQDTFQAHNPHPQVPQLTLPDPDHVAKLGCGSWAILPAAIKRSILSQKHGTGLHKAQE